MVGHVCVIQCGIAFEVDSSDINWVLKHHVHIRVFFKGMIYMVVKL